MRRRLAVVVSSLSLGALLVLPPGRASAVGERFALVVGVGSFQRGSPLPGSAGDAVDFTKLLVNNGWEAGNVRTLIDRRATASAIRAGLDWLASRCELGTACAFHYSGHVKQGSFDDGDRETRDEALWPYDATFIPDGEVAWYLRRLQGVAWVDISGCEAAGFDDGVSSPARVFTGSSAETEKSYESPAYKNSVWTELLVNQELAAGKNLAAAFAAASARAPIETAKQSRGPQHPYMTGGNPAGWFGPAAAAAAPPFRAELLHTGPSASSKA